MNRIAALINTESSEHRALALAKTLLNTDGGTIDVITTVRKAPQLLHVIWPDQVKGFERDISTS